MRRGLELAEKRMLQEKARNNEDVIVCGDDNVIRRIPAKQVIVDNRICQDQRNHTLIPPHSSCGGSIISLRGSSPLKTSVFKHGIR